MEKIKRKEKKKGRKEKEKIERPTDKARCRVACPRLKMKMI